MLLPTNGMARDLADLAYRLEDLRPLTIRKLEELARDGEAVEAAEGTYHDTRRQDCGRVARECRRLLAARYALRERLLREEWTA